MPNDRRLASTMEVHDFETTPFWEPRCVTCHEKENHPVHHADTPQMICGYDPCEHCEKISESGRGVPSYE